MGGIYQPHKDACEFIDEEGVERGGGGERASSNLLELLGRIWLGTEELQLTLN